MTAGFLENTDINHLRHLGQLFFCLCHLRFDFSFSLVQFKMKNIFENILYPGMGKGRDGTVPRFFFPVPLVPRKFVLALSPGPDHGDLRDGTGIPTLSRDNRPFLTVPVNRG